MEKIDKINVNFITVTKALSIESTSPFRCLFQCPQKKDRRLVVGDKCVLCKLLVDGVDRRTDSSDTIRIFVVCLIKESKPGLHI